MTLSELSLKLHQLAESVNQLQANLQIPAQAYSLSEALNKLRAVVGDEALITVGFQLSQFSASQRPTIEWTVYDGHEFSPAPTLAAAVNKLIYGHAPESPNPVEEAQQLLAVAAGV